MPHFDEWGSGGTLPNLNEVLLKSPFTHGDQHFGRHGLSNSRISEEGRKKGLLDRLEFGGAYSSLPPPISGSERFVA